MRRVAVGIVGVGLLLVAVALAGWAVLGRHHTRVGQNVFVNPAGIIDAYSTPSITVDPKAANRVVVVYREDRPNLSARLGWSDNGGTTFQPTALPLPPGLDRPFFPDTVFGSDGVLYVVYVNLGGNGNVPANLWLARSDNGGQALSAPTMLATGMTFQPRITAAASGTLTVTWLQSNRRAQGGLTGDQVRLMAVQSTDRGQTWSPAAPVNAADGRLVSAGSAVVDGRSTVVAYERFGPTATNLGTGGTTAAPDTYDLVVTRSPAAAASFSAFSAPVVVASGLHTTQRFSLFFPQFPSLAAAPDGSLYLTWTQGLAKGQDALVSRSTDGGASWGTPVRANDNRPGDGTTRLLPTLSVASNGRVDVVLIDQRNDASGLFAEAYLASSMDHGRTFHDIRLSSAAFDTRVGPSFGGNLPPDLGSHLSVVSESSVVQAAWADSRLGNENTGRQDIVAARISIGSSGSRLPLLIVAAVLLVAAAGCLVLFIRGSGANDSEYQFSS